MKNRVYVSLVLVAAELVAVPLLEESLVTVAGGGLGYTASLFQYFKRPR